MKMKKFNKINKVIIGVIWVIILSLIILGIFAYIYNNKGTTDSEKEYYKNIYNTLIYIIIGLASCFFIIFFVDIYPSKMYDMYQEKLLNLEKN